MNLFYDQTAGCLCNADGVRTIVKPALRYKEKPVWNITVLTGSTAADLSSVETFRAAVDVDFSAGTDVMCRTLNAGIDQTGKASGVLQVALDCNTTTFLTAVDGNSEKTAWFELWGFNSSGNACFYLRFPIIVSGVVDPDSGPVPTPVQNGIADAAQIAAMLVNKAAATHTHTASDITDMPTIPVAPSDIGAAPASHTHAQADVTSLTASLSGKANTSHTHTQAQVSGLSSALAGKANSTHTHAASEVTGLAAVAVSGSYNDLADQPTIPATPAAHIVETWTAADGLSWYRLYSDGWIEQGGTGSAATSQTVTITLPHAMASATYTAIKTYASSGSDTLVARLASIYNKTTTTFQTYGGSYSFDWYVCGNAAS